MIKFLPSYVGSKAYWISQLEFLRGENIIELFCGSAVISANLAKKAVLNDLDPKLYTILSQFDELVEQETFTLDEYMSHRKDEDWWRYAFYFQKMSFSGVFRYSKNGYNVPSKKMDSVSILPDLLEAKKRMKELNPIILNKSYIDVDLNAYDDYAIILDPPYQGSQASYNSSFNYKQYWDFVESLKGRKKPIVIFDRLSNLESYPNKLTRKMRVNGKHKGDEEAMVILNRNEYNLF